MEHRDERCPSLWQTPIKDLPPAPPWVIHSGAWAVWGLMVGVCLSSAGLL